MTTIRTAVFLTVWLWPSVALACPYCRSYAEEQDVYYLVTVVMLMVPMVMVAGLAIWLWRASKRPVQESPRGGVQ